MLSSSVWPQAPTASRSLVTAVVALALVASAPLPAAVAQGGGGGASPQAEAQASQVFERARRLVERGQYEQASDSLRLLRLAHARTAFVASHEGEIRDLETQVRTALWPGRGRFRGEVTLPAEGVLRIRYPFADAREVADFEVAGATKSPPEVGTGGLSAKRASPAVLRHVVAFPVSGAASFEVEGVGQGTLVLALSGDGEARPDDGLAVEVEASARTIALRVLRGPAAVAEASAARQKGARSDAPWTLRATLGGGKLSAEITGDGLDAAKVESAAPPPPAPPAPPAGTAAEPQPAGGGADGGSADGSGGRGEGTGDGMGGAPPAGGAPGDPGAPGTPAPGDPAPPAPEEPGASRGDGADPLADPLAAPAAPGPTFRPGLVFASGAVRVRALVLEGPLPAATDGDGAAAARAPLPRGSWIDLLPDGLTGWTTRDRDAWEHKDGAVVQVKGMGQLTCADLDGRELGSYALAMELRAVAEGRDARAARQPYLSIALPAGDEQITLRVTARQLVLEEMELTYGATLPLGQWTALTVRFDAKALEIAMGGKPIFTVPAKDVLGRGKPGLSFTALPGGPRRIEIRAVKLRLDP